MNYVVLTLLLGGSCGYFQYWMTVRLARKRWLLLLQPALLGAAAVCFAVWTLGIDRLKGTPARLAWIPFAALLACTAAGWAIGERRRKGP